MEDDDDAFLYGGDPPATSTAAPEADKEVSAPAADSHPPAADGEKPAQEGDSDAEEEEEDSDSDVEFIIDTTQEAPPPQARPGMPGYRPGSTQTTPQRPPPSAITSEYTPLSRAQLAGASPTKAAAPEQSQSQPQQEEQAEGPPPPVPSTAPVLKLSPAPEDRVYPPPADSVIAAAEVETDIFDINIEALDDKPWRRPGADLTDYFNYGFNEQSWSLWRGKKERLTETRKEMEKRGEEGMMPMMGGPMGVPNPEQMMAMMGMGGPMGMMNNMFGGGPPGFQGPNAQMPGRGPAPGRNNFGGPQQGSSTPATEERGKDDEDDGEPPYEPADDHDDAHRGNNMSEQDMSAFFGASGVDMNQVAAAGFNVPPPTGPSGRGGSPAARGRGPSGWAARGRGQGVRGAPTGPRGAPSGPAADRAPSPLPSNVPTGPRNPGKRYNDRDTGAGAADALDYGATSEDRRPSRRRRDDTPEDDRRNSRRSRRRDDDSDDTDASKGRRRARERDRDSRRSDRRAGKEGSSRKRSQPDEPEDDTWSDRDSRRGGGGRKKR